MEPGCVCSRLAQHVAGWRDLKPASKPGINFAVASFARGRAADTSSIVWWTTESARCIVACTATRRQLLEAAALRFLSFSHRRRRLLADALPHLIHPALKPPVT